MFSLLSTRIHSALTGSVDMHVVRREIVAFAKLLAPVIAILSVVANFHEFVMHAIMANVAINGLIISAASYGIFLIVVRQVSAQKDFFIIERFGREAMRGVYMPQLLEEPWLKRRYVRHYLGHIAETGGTLSSALQQDAIENELRELNTEYEHKLELPQFLVGFMIAMGLLGTFIGLLETLTGISGMLEGFGGTGANMDEQFMKLVVELKKPLAGMGIAFSASMFGLVTSLMLALMMINLRRYISRVVSCARNVMHDLTKLGGAAAGAKQMTAGEIEGMALSATSRASSAANIFDGALSSQDIAYEIRDASLGTAARIEGLTRKIDAILQSFEASNKSTQRLSDLLGFGPRMKETSEAMLDELKGISSGQIEQQKFFQRLIDISNDTIRAINGIVESQRESQVNLTTSLKNVGSSVNDVASRVMNGIVNAQREAQAGLALSLRDMEASSNDVATRVMKGIVDAQHESHAGLTVLLKDMEASTNDTLVRAMNGIIAAQRESQASLTSSLKDMGSSANESSLRVMNGIVVAQRDSQASLTSSLKEVVVNANDAAARVMSGIVDAQHESQASLVSSLKDVVVNANDSSAHLMSGIVTAQRETQTSLMVALKELSEKLIKIEQSNITLGKHLWDIKETFTNLASCSNVGEAISTGVGQHTVLLEALVQEDRNLQKRLASIQQDLRELLQPPANDDTGSISPTMLPVP